MIALTLPVETGSELSCLLNKQDGQKNHNFMTKSFKHHEKDEQFSEI